MNTQLTPSVVTTIDSRDAHLVREIVEAGRILKHATNRAERYVRIARLRWSRRSRRPQPRRQKSRHPPSAF